MGFFRYANGGGFDRTSIPEDNKVSVYVDMAADDLIESNLRDLLRGHPLVRVRPDETRNERSTLRLVSGTDCLESAYSRQA